MTADRQTLRVPLHRVAHGRTGDKGNRINVSIIPFHPSCFAAIGEQITEARVHDCFCHRGASRVVRYVLLNLPAYNFVVDDVLEGGVNGSLNLDGHGKSLVFHILDLEIEIEDDLLRKAEAHRAG